MCRKMRLTTPVLLSVGAKDQTREISYIVMVLIVPLAGFTSLVWGYTLLHLENGCAQTVRVSLFLK